MLHNALVSDTGPLSYFVAGRVFHVLRDLFAGRLYIPPTVVSESRGATEVGNAVAAALRGGWLLETQLSPDELALALGIGERYGVDQGEAEAIALASSRAWVLVCNEKPGRTAALDMGLKVTGSMGILYKAVELGVLAPQQADEAIAYMRAANQWVPVGRYGGVKAHVEADPARAEWLRSL